jgi:hypothetical protein
MRGMTVFPSRLGRMVELLYATLASMAPVLRIIAI